MHGILYIQSVCEYNFYNYVFFCSSGKRLSDAQIRQALLADIPSGSDASGSEEDSEDEYVPKSRDRDIYDPYTVAGESSMFPRQREQEQADNENGSDSYDSDIEEDNDVPAAAYDEEELPDLNGDATVGGAGIGGQLAAKKGKNEKKLWTWVKEDLPPQEMPENSVKPVGFAQCRFPVDFFMKMFGEDNWQLLVEQSNIYRYVHIHFITWLGRYSTIIHNFYVHGAVEIYTVHTVYPLSTQIFYLLFVFFSGLRRARESLSSVRPR
jgi:hypothetical protein